MLMDFYGSSLGLPGGSCQGLPQRTLGGCWDGVGAAPFSEAAGVFPGSRLAGGAPPPLRGLWRGLAMSCAAGEWSGRVEREGGWATWFLWLRRGRPLPRGLRLGAVLAGLWLGVAR